MTERHLKCGADSCHFCCCCTSRHGCLRRHVIWHLNNWDKIGLPPSSTIQLLDELEFENDKLWGATPENENSNNENAENENKVSNSSCDGDNAQNHNGTKVQHNNGTKVQLYDGTTKSSCGAKPAATAGTMKTSCGAKLAAAAGRRATLKNTKLNKTELSSILAKFKEKFR